MDSKGGLSETPHPMEYNSMNPMASRPDEGSIMLPIASDVPNVVVGTSANIKPNNVSPVISSPTLSVNRVAIPSVPPPPTSKSKGISLNPLDLIYMISGKRKKVPTSREVAVELGKLEKLAGKMALQQKRVLEVLRDWGADLPEPETREFMSNMYNLLSGPLNVYNELQGRLVTIHSHFLDLTRMEDHNLRVENELKATQKLYYKANYRDFPAYQIDSYQASYENICSEIDELHLRHRNRLVSMIKQSYQLVLQQMLDSHQKQKVCGETGIRFLAAFDAEPKEVLPEGYVAYSSVYVPGSGSGSGPGSGSGTGTMQGNTGPSQSLYLESSPRNGLEEKSNLNHAVGNSSHVEVGPGSEDSHVMRLSMSPDTQKIGMNDNVSPNLPEDSRGYHFYNTISDENNGGTEEINHKGKRETMKSLMTHRLKAQTLGPNDMNIPPRIMTVSAGEKGLSSGNRAGLMGGYDHGFGARDGNEGSFSDDEDEDERIVKPAIAPLQSYPTGFFSSFRYG